MTLTSELNDANITTQEIVFKDDKGAYQMSVDAVTRVIAKQSFVVNGWITYDPGKKKEQKRPFSMPVEAWNALCKTVDSNRAVLAPAVDSTEGM
jgi:hypothetical protein